jgi:hypothetical protein
MGKTIGATKSGGSIDAGIYDTHPVLPVIKIPKTLSAGPLRIGSAASLPAMPVTAWQELPGNFPVSYSTNQARYPGQLSQPVYDPNNRQVLAVIPDGSGTNRLGIWQGQQWSFSSLPPSFRAMAYDPARKQVIAVSEHQRAERATSPEIPDDSWAWSGNAWQPIQLGTPVTMGGQTSLVYDPSAQGLELVSYFPFMGGGGLSGYAHSELGPQGTWRVIQCGYAEAASDFSWQACGIPGVPVPTVSLADKKPLPALPEADVLGYDPRLHAVIGSGPVLSFPNPAVGVLALSNGYWQPIGSGAPKLPGGAWAGAYDSQTLWIAGYATDGGFHLYRDDTAGNFHEVTLTRTPPPAPAIPAGLFSQSDFLTAYILPKLWLSSLAYDPSNQQLLWLEYGNPQWTQWSPDGLGSGTVSLQATTWTFSTSS